MTQPSTKLHPMLATQVRNAETKIIQIEAVAVHLAGLMQEAHGVDFRIQIEHDVGLIVIVPKPAAKPVDNGEAGENEQP